MDTSGPPSEDECARYYYGLPSGPRLVARSSTSPWAPPTSEDFGQSPKILKPVAHHSVASLWNLHTEKGSLRSDVLEVLKKQRASWAAIDMLRAGYLDHPDGFQTVLFISVVPNSTTWAQGHAIVTKVQSILTSHGIGDITCEVKESQVHRLASQETETLPQLLQAPLHGPYHSYKHQLSDQIGTSIASQATPAKEGTKCIYLTAGQRSHGTTTTNNKAAQVVFALTCRHVCLPMTDTAEYLPTCSPLAPLAPLAPTAQVMIQPGAVSFAKALAGIKTNNADLAALAFKVEHSPKLDPATRLARLDAIRAHVRNSQQVLDDVESRMALGSRAFGRVIYARGLDVQTTFLTDWALISLDAQRHQESLLNLRNRVHVGNISLQEMFMEQQRMVPFAQPDADGTITLANNVIPVSEMEHPTTLNVEDEATMIVGKRGRGSGLTWGLSSGIRSVIRCPSSLSHEVYSDEWCIVGADGLLGSAFSTGGDSGACVWDVQGRIGGMITGGNSANGAAMDVTYATPMEWILEDMKACGLNVNIV
ncbi:hypothetical protein ColLi_12210 [Colletotrichum liriopes]|uniref:Peptidase S1 domain-containing protein n=1 Tax=Colletotrichum liriopes TaxID=708192 RepID=A0AA37GZX7_9PEZI|nr:hypothetical protein ColLi_12210 [Colletotrichum liriopes]